MEGLFLLLVVAFTSAIAAALVRRKQADTWRRLGHACAVTLECLGCGLLCYALNLGLAVTVVIIVRNLTPVFLSLYLCGDTTLLLLSLLQGTIVWNWIGRVQLFKS
jgi:hypothetical protein